MRRTRRNCGRKNPFWGVTSGEQQRNPRRRTPSPFGPRARLASGHGPSGVLLGILDEMVIETPGQVVRADHRSLKGLFLAWIPKTNSLVIVRKVKGRPGRLDSATVRTHRLFHNVKPTTASAFDQPTRNGTEETAGLLRSLTYVIPPKMKSPEKKGFKWVHLFGDHGESGHGNFKGEKRYPDHLKPELLVNSKGDLFIRRRPGNRFDVSKWIYW